MCGFNTLCNNEDGYVARCKSCKQFHVGFGTNILAFSFDEFVDFTQTITEYYDAYKLTDSPNSKIVQIPTVARSIVLLYSVNELKKLLKLLNKAKDAAAMEKLFIFCEN